jgi:hypothetical protein
MPKPPAGLLRQHHTLWSERQSKHALRARMKVPPR